MRFSTQSQPNLGLSCYKAPAFPFLLQNILGKTLFKIAELYEQCGPVVQVGTGTTDWPTSVGRTWSDIYGQHPAVGQMLKADQQVVNMLDHA